MMMREPPLARIYFKVGAQAFNPVLLGKFFTLSDLVYILSLFWDFGNLRLGVA